MAKNTNDESVEKSEPTVTFNRKKLVTAGWIAGGVLALGATFAAGSAVGHVLDGPRGDHAAVGSTGISEGHGPQGGDHMGGPQGGRDGDHGMGEGPHGMGHGPQGELGEMQGQHHMDAPTDGSTVEGTVPAPTTTP